VRRCFKKDDLNVEIYEIFVEKQNQKFLVNFKLVLMKKNMKENIKKHLLKFKFILELIEIYQSF
jgi:hypothetical protein